MVVFGIPAHVGRAITDADREYMATEVAREFRLVRIYRRLFEETAAD